ncbi:MAG TPA: homocysteine S-methyltransferase family protein [Ktedonobacterales bacterium]|jgi:5-methyltetrahydrofolate--homocysteine methyltransferase
MSSNHSTQHHSRFLQELQRRVIIFDGAMGTNIQNYHLGAADYGGERTEGCNEYLVITRPDVIEEIHSGFMEAGSDVLETDTFTGSRMKLDEYGLGERTREINLAAAQLARRVADRYSTLEKPRFVAGSIGPTGMLPSSDDPALSNITYQQLAEIFREQAAALIEGGVDLLIIETSQDILEVRAAIAGIRRAFNDLGRTLPIQAQVTLDTSGRMLLGTDIAAAMTILVNLGVNVVGLNCSTGPQHMREPVRYLAENCPLPISTIPNAGIPLNVGGKAVYPMEPAPMAEALREFVEELGVNIVGGCCGNTHEHLRQIVQAVSGVTRKPRPAQNGHATSGAGGVPEQGSGGRWPAAASAFANGGGAVLTTSAPYVASGIHAAPLIQDPPPLLVGERVNSTGSKKAKQALLSDDYDTLLAIAREQVEGGAHTLDVQVALTERSDEAEQMRRTVKKLSMGIEAPLVFDSTEANVIQAALESYPGRAIINSINMENGRQRIEAVLPLAKEHGAAVVALTIDEEGMGKTAERKFEIARRIYQICTTEYGLRPDALIFDTLTFPVTTGQEELQSAAVETIEGIRRIKAELPGALTILGVSNVSFGVAQHARAVLNSVFLFHAVQAGLDAAIVNPAHITPYAEIDAEQRELADDLLLNRRADALPRFIEYFEQHGAQKKEQEKADPTEGMTTDEKIHYQILHRKKEGIETLLDQALLERLARSDDEGFGPEAYQDLVAARKPTAELSQAAVTILNTVLLPAMKDVGDKFGAGELILPFVLQSAEVMKRAVAHLEHFLERKEGYTKGKVVLATVFGDVHDIGKNLVNTILSNNGYTVYDLGKQVPLNTIIDKATEVQADAIGLSALLVSTSKQMPLCVQELHKRGLRFPVIVGGAAINRAYGRRIIFVGDDDQKAPYESGLFYAKDAFEGLEIMDKLSDPQRRESFVAQIRREAIEAAQNAQQAAESRANEAASKPQAPAVIALDRSRFALDTLPTPPFWGPRVLERIGLEEVAACMDLNTLYRLHWGGKAHGEEFKRLVREDFEPRLERMLREARQRRYMEPKAVYGYYPCQSDGDELILYDPQDHNREIERFTMPRQPDQERLCLADYFASVASGRKDVVALQVVTVGQKTTDLIDELQASGDYSAAYYIHGLGAEMAEGMAEYVHRIVRRELGLLAEQGKRYSWGYPAIPELEDHVKVFRALPVRETIGVDLTISHQLVPEQSTAAIVAHHPRAVYFSVRQAREAAPAI